MKLPRNSVPNSSWVVEDFMIIAALVHFVAEEMNLCRAFVGASVGANVIIVVSSWVLTCSGLASV